MKFTPLFTGAMVLGLVTVPFAFAADATSDQERFVRQIGSETGVPVPGSVSDQETTKKHRNPAKDQGADQNAQVTMGGAKYFVSGEIRSIQGDYYFIKD